MRTGNRTGEIGRIEEDGEDKTKDIVLGSESKSDSKSRGGFLIADPEALAQIAAFEGGVTKQDGLFDEINKNRPESAGTLLKVVRARKEKLQTLSQNSLSYSIVQPFGYR